MSQAKTRATSQVPPIQTRLCHIVVFTIMRWAQVGYSNGANGGGLKATSKPPKPSPCWRELDLAATVDADLAEHLIGDALENVVSAFDGFGREIWRAGPVPRVAADEIEKLVTKLVREHLDLEQPTDDRALINTHVSRVEMVVRATPRLGSNCASIDTARLLVMRVLNAI
jgi:hypothetical protein